MLGRGRITNKPERCIKAKPSNGVPAQIFMETKEKKKSWITVKETIDGLQRSYETLKVLYFSYGVRFKTTTKDRGAEIFVPYEHISSIVTIPLHPKKEEVG